MTQTLGIVRSQLVPLAGMNLVLPNTCIAEVIGYQPPEPVAGAPEWLLGNIDWRGVRLPLISFEALNGAQQAATDRRSRIAILNGIGGDEELPFFGVVTQGIPRLMVLDNTAISVVSQPDNDYPLALQQTLVQDQEAIIPDQEKLEDMIRQQGIKVTA